eukprot:s345_g8.t1
MDAVCLQHKRFDRIASASATEINSDGSRASQAQGHDEVSLSYGIGEIVGDFVRDVVCIGAPGSLEEGRCTSARVILARHLTTEPFQHFEFDGVLGLGLNGLALNPEFHLFSQPLNSQLAGRSSIQQTFSVFLARPGASGSQVTFGGQDEGRTEGETSWVPVSLKEKGYWAVRILAVRAGNKDCQRVPGPRLSFELDGGSTIELSAEEFSRPAPTAVTSSATGKIHSVCRALLVPVEMPAISDKVFLFGEPVLQKHASSFQNEQGFAEGSPQYSAALKLHITAAADAEKKEKVKESKENLLSIIQAEFPQYIEFLSSSSTEGKESIELKSQKAGKASVPGISLAGLMLGSDSKGGSLLDEFSRIREQLTGAKSVGREIQADLARTATLLGKFAVRSLDSRTRPVSEEALALQQAIASPRALLMGTEAAALELFTGTKQRAVVRSSRQTLKAAQVFLGVVEDLSPYIVEVYLRTITSEAAPLTAARAEDILYYTAFDAKEFRVGFALAKHNQGEMVV